MSFPGPETFSAAQIQVITFYMQLLFLVSAPAQYLTEAPLLKFNMSSGTIFSPFSPSDLLLSRGIVTIGSQLFSLPLPLSTLLSSNQVYFLSTSVTTAITTPWTSSSPRSPSPSGSQILICFQFFHFFPHLSDCIHSNLACTHMFLKKLPRDD